MVAVNFAGMKKFSKLGSRSLESIAQSATSLAVVSFGLAMIGVEVSTANAWAMYLCAALGGGLLSAAHTLATWGAQMNLRTLNGFTVIAIWATVAYGFLVIGTIASIDAEVIK